MDFIFQFTILFKKFRVILYFVNRPLKNMHSNHTGNYKYLQLAKKNHIRISNILKECSCIRIKEYPYSKRQCFCKYSNVFCKYSNVFCKCLDLTLYYNTMNTKHLNNIYCIHILLYL